MTYNGKGTFSKEDSEPNKGDDVHFGLVGSALEAVLL
jgi:hypothetical protein